MTNKMAQDRLKKMAAALNDYESALSRYHKRVGQVDNDTADDLLEAISQARAALRLAFHPDLRMVHVDDWAALYVDGREAYQGHSVRDEDILLALGYDVSEEGISTWVDDKPAFRDNLARWAGRFPDTYREVEDALRDDRWEALGL